MDRVDDATLLNSIGALKLVTIEGKLWWVLTDEGEDLITWSIGENSED